MDADQVSEEVARGAEQRALAALKRRRPGLRVGSVARVPPDERAQFELDRLAHTRAAAERLDTDITTLVIAARKAGASWAKVGPALNESPQTAFNRYRRFEQPTPVGRR